MIINQPRVRVGDVIRAALWATGKEDRETVIGMMDQIIAEITRVCDGARVDAATPPEWHECFPGDGRVADPPDHIQGPNVRAMVAEVTVLSIGPTESKFLAELEPSDLRRLRKITRDAHKTWWRKTFPRHAWPRPSDRQCDSLVNELGPDVAYEALQKGWTRLAGDEAETVH